MVMAPMRESTMAASEAKNGTEEVARTQWVVVARPEVLGGVQ